MEKKPSPDDIVSTEAAAALLMLSPPTFVDLSKKGWFKAISPDHWRLVDVVQGYVHYLEDRRRFATSAELAAEFGVSSTTIRTLGDAGVLPRGETMAAKREVRWDWLACRKAFSKYSQRPRAEGSAEGQRRVVEARARDIETKTRMLMDDLIPTAEAVSVLTTVEGVIRKVFTAQRFGDDQVLQKRAKAEIADALDRIREHRDRAVAALRTGKDPTRL